MPVPRALDAEGALEPALEILLLEAAEARTCAMVRRPEWVVLLLLMALVLLITETGRPPALSSECCLLRGGGV